MVKKYDQFDGVDAPFVERINNLDRYVPVKFTDVTPKVVTVSQDGAISSSDMNSWVLYLKNTQGDSDSPQLSLKTTLTVAAPVDAFKKLHIVNNSDTALDSGGSGNATRDIVLTYGTHINSASTKVTLTSGEYICLSASMNGQWVVDSTDGTEA